MKIAANNMNQHDQRSHNYLVVKFHNDFKDDNKNTGIINTAKNYEIQCNQILKLFSNLIIGRLFNSLSDDKIGEVISKACRSDPSYHPTDLFSYYRIICPEEINLHDLRKSLLKLEYVELAYIQGATNCPSPVIEAKPIYSLQGYLNPGPAGINAKYAWKKDGGTGKGNVKFIDIEQGWGSGNESIDFQTLPLTGINERVFGYHGSSVLTIIMGKENIEGYAGITPDTTGYVISQWRPDGLHNDADAILSAISYLQYGDVLLLESQSFDSGNGNSLWPVEIHAASFTAIRLATALGIIVIEAGGNGSLLNKTGNDLDQYELNGQKILNPASPDFKESGALIVAGAFQNVPHNRISYSNYGSRVNCYAWGNGVVTIAEYPESEKSPARLEKRKLSGTSSASAIIAGAAIAVQSIYEAKYNKRLGPKQMRDLLSNELYGTPSVNGHGNDKIGVMPDLKKITDNYLNLPLH